MSDFKDAIDKTEEVARKIWLAGLGAYGQSLENVQEGYEKMNDQTRKYFDDLVARGEEIESEAKGKLSEARRKLDETGGKLKSATDKLKDRSQQLKQKGEKFKEDALNINIAERLEEIRSKVSEKLSLPELPEVPKLSQQKLLEDLNKGLEDLTASVTNLLKGQKGKAEAEKAPAKKTASKKTATKKTVAKKPAAKKPTAKKPAAKKPAVKKAEVETV